jgi:S-DNA-T family DNA segregation ATPase FtsK/SpoIIIE
VSRSIYLTRGQRQYRTAPTGEIKIPNFPGVPSEPRKPSWLILLAPTGAMLALSLLVSFLTDSPSMGTFLLISGPAMSLVAFLRYHQQKRDVESETARVLTAYNKRLSQVLKIADGFQAQQLDSLAWRYPPPEELLGWVKHRSSRIWERRPGEPDFLNLRLGTHTTSPSYELKLPPIDIPELAPIPLLEAHRKASPYLKLEKAPFGWDLDKHGSLAIVGEHALRQSLARALVAQVAALHAPDEVQLWALYPPSEVDRWAWLKWLPHTAALQNSNDRRRLASQSTDGQRIISTLTDEIQARGLRINAKQKLDTPTLLLLVTQPGLVAGEPLLEKLLNHAELGVKIILLAPDSSSLPNGFHGWIELHNRENATLHQGPQGSKTTFNPDGLGWRTSEKLGRGLAPFRLAENTVGDPLPDEVQLMDLVDPPSLKSLDLEERWREALCRPPHLKTVLGMRTGNRPLVIDLKQNRHGPHGLIAGTTGSGKSELLLTLLCGLAIDHHPHQVNFVLVDYKGGTAMAALAELPHTVGLVTDLDGKQTRRALRALRSELKRREQILARHQVADIDKYHQCGFEEPFPYLLIVIDEFAELRQHFADDLSNILNEFISVAQKGRALGVHLILAMQKPEGIVSDSIRANMKFRICLRVERAEDSRNVIGRNDAYLLPNQPAGRAYFQVGNEQFDLFQVARIAGPEPLFAASASTAINEVGPDGRRIHLKEITPMQESPSPTPGVEALTQAQILVEMAKQAGQSMQIKRLPSPWPPPLPVSIELDDLLERHPLPGWNGHDWNALDQDAGANLRPFPMALVDAPEEQEQSPLLLDLNILNSLIVVGAPGSGKTMSLLTMILSLSRRHRPDELHFHILAFGGHQFHGSVTELPHVAGVYDHNDPEKIRRLLVTLTQMLEARRQAFADLLSYRRLSGKNNQPTPAIVIVIDNLSGFLEYIADGDTGWRRLLREGSSYGLYFLMSSDRMPPNHMADLINGRIALQLADSTWYSVVLGGRPDLNSYDPIPGRGFLAGKPPAAIQMALAYKGQPEQVLNRIRNLGDQMKKAWQGPTPEPIQVLPDRVPLSQILAGSVPSMSEPKGLSATIGLEAESLEPQTASLSRYGTTFLVSGPPESGKTTSLITLTLSIALSYSPRSVGMVLATANRAQAQLWKILAGLPHCHALLQSEAEFSSWMKSIEDAADSNADPKPVIMIMDDQPMWANRVSSQTVSHLEAVIRRGEVLGFTYVASLPAAGLNARDGVARTLKTGRIGLWLKSTDASEAALVGLRLPHIRETVPYPVGRGYLYHPGDQRLVQTATPFDEARKNELTEVEQLEGWVQRVQDRWGSVPKLALAPAPSGIHTDVIEMRVRE